MLGKEVDAYGVDEREGDEAVVQDHQRRQKAIKDALQLFAEGQLDTFLKIPFTSCSWCSHYLSI